MSNNSTYKAPKTNSMAAISTYVVISVIIFFYGLFNIENALVVKLSLLLGGVLVFTFLEYVFHRFVYHSGKGLSRRRKLAIQGPRRASRSSNR